MNYLIIFLAVLILLIAAGFAVPAKIRFRLDSENRVMQITLCWLYPFLKSSVSMKNGSPVMSFYIFSKHIHSHTLKPGKKRSFLQMLHSISMKDSSVKAYYSFSNPMYTGLAHGFFQIILPFADRIESMEDYPDFFSENEYVLIHAGAKINIGKTLTNYFQLKSV